MTSPKRLSNEGRTRSKEYCESSHEARDFCFMLYRAFMTGSISDSTPVAGPYFAEMDFTMSAAVRLGRRPGSARRPPSKFLNQQWSSVNHLHVSQILTAML